jgi:hypothetical protein
MALAQAAAAAAAAAAVTTMAPSSSLDAIVSPQGCPIKDQSETTLALVCRFLSIADLVSVARSSRQLASAVANPITFSYPIRFSIDSWDAVGVHVHGNAAACEFESPLRLRDALQSRFARHFRVLSLHTVPALKELLTHADVGARLQALTLRPTGSPDWRRLDSNQPLNLFGMQQLRVLSLVLPNEFLEELLTPMPPQLEVLHIAQNVQPSGLSLLRFRPNLRHFLVRDPRIVALGSTPKQNAFGITVTPTTIEQMRELQHLQERSPQLETLTWLIPVPYRPLVEQAGREAPLPVVRKITRLLMTDLRPIDPTTSILSVFPDLVELRFRGADFRKNALTKGTTMPLVQWPAANRASLRDLRVLNLSLQSADTQEQQLESQQALLNYLAAAELSALERLHIVGQDLTQHLLSVPTGLADFQPLFKTLGRLRHLSMRGFRMADFKAFKLLPHLTALREITWPTSQEMQQQPKTHLAECLPALQSLGVVAAESTSAFPWREHLELVPSLRSVTWRREPACHPAQLAHRQALLAAERARRDAAAEATAAAAMAQARAMHKAGLAPLTEEQRWYVNEQQLNQNTGGDMEETSTRLRREWEAKMAAEALAAKQQSAGQFVVSGVSAGSGGDGADVGAVQSSMLGFSLGGASTTSSSSGGGGAKGRMSGGGRRSAGGAGARHSLTPAKPAAATVAGESSITANSFSFSPAPETNSGNAFGFNASAAAAPPAFSFSSAASSSSSSSEAPFSFSFSPAPGAAAPSFASSFPTAAPSSASSPFTFTAPAAAAAATVAPSFTVPPPSAALAAAGTGASSPAAAAAATAAASST